MNFVCEKCRHAPDKPAEHCGRPREDSWCDCQHRSQESTQTKRVAPS